MKPLEIHATEMSTTRMKSGEPHLAIWVTGPRGGGRAMLRFDRAETEKLLKSLARACAALEEAATAEIYASGFRRQSKASKAAKVRAKKLAALRKRKKITAPVNRKEQQ